MCAGIRTGFDGWRVCLAVATAGCLGVSGCSQVAENETGDRIGEESGEVRTALTSAVDHSSGLMLRPDEPYLGAVAQPRKHGQALPSDLRGRAVQLVVSSVEGGISGSRLLELASVAAGVEIGLDEASYRQPVELMESGEGCEEGVLVGQGGEISRGGARELTGLGPQPVLAVAPLPSADGAEETGSSRVVAGEEADVSHLAERFMTRVFEGRFQFSGSLEELLAGLVRWSPALGGWRYDGERILFGYFVDRVFEVHLIPAGESADELWDELRVSLAPVIGRGGFARTFCRRGVVEVRATRESMSRVAEVVRQFNDRVTRQMVLEVELYGVVQSSDNSSGFSLGALFEGDRIGVNFGGSIEAREDALERLEEQGGPGPADLDVLGPGSVAIIDPGSRWVGSAAFFEALQASSAQAGKLDAASLVLLDGRRQSLHIGTEKTIVVGTTQRTSGSEGAVETVEEQVLEFSDGFSLEVVARMIGGDSVIVAYEVNLNEVSVGQGALRVLNEKRTLGNEVVMPVGSRLAITAFEEEQGSGNASAGLLSGGSLLSAGFSDVVSRTSYVVSLRVSRLSRDRLRRGARGLR